MKQKTFVLEKGQGSGVLANSYYGYFVPFFHVVKSSKCKEAYELTKALKSIKKGDRIELKIIKGK